MLDEYSMFEKKNLLQHGFIVHSGYPYDAKTIANYHTHGLAELNNHKDLQIVLPIEAKMAFKIFEDVVKMIKDGDVLFKNKIIDVNLSIKVKLSEVIEDERKVLRLLIADSNGLFPDEYGCDILFSLQNLE